jgi:opacity protein-like surface antigen
MRSLLALMALLLLPAGGTMVSDAHGQADNRFSVSVEATMVQPVFGLRDRFDAHPSWQAGVGRWLEDGRSYVELRFETYGFAQRQGVVLRADTLRPDYDVEALGMSLDMLGGGLYLQRNLRTTGFARPFLLGGITLHHWEETRAAYQDDNLDVPVLARPAQWSAGFTGGLGSEFYVMPRLAVNVGGNYSIVMGELWPTLVLGLENVSTFHYLSVGLGLRTYF